MERKYSRTLYDLTPAMRQSGISLSGRFRNSEREGSATGAQSAVEKFWDATPTSGHVKVRTEYLEATLGLVKRLEISKELIRERVTIYAWLFLLHATAA